MKIKSLFLGILLITISFLTYDVKAQWSPSNGPAGAYILSMIVQNGTVMIGTNEGLLTTTSLGGTWTASPGIFATQCFAHMGNSILAGTVDGKIFSSTNQGATWTALTAINQSLKSLFVNGTDIYAATFNGFYKSSNNGSSWSQVGGGLPTNSSCCMVTIGGNLLAGVTGGVYVSSNNGTSWAASNSGLTSLSITAMIVIGTKVVVGTGSGLFISSNNGASWSAGGFTGKYIYSLATDGTTIFAGTDSGIYTSSNSGSSWVNATIDIASPPSCFEFLNSYVLAGGSAGVFISSDNGGVWADANGSLSYPSPRCFFANSSTVLVGTYGGGIFKTTDQGLHWSSSNSGLMSNGFIYSMAYDGTTLFAGTPKGVIKSTDLGANWTTANTGISNTIVLALAASNGKVFASISGGGVYLSSDNGTSWSAVNTGLSNTDVRSLLISGSNILAGTAQGLFKSSDNGSNWSAVNGITVNNVWSLISFGSSLYAATDNGVFKSIDNGASWVATSTGLPSSTPVGSITVAQNTLFAGTNNGVYFSANNGASWANGNDGLTGIPKALLANGSYVYAGIDGTSVYTRAISNFNPTITSISPISGPVGTSVTIKGTNFDFNAANDSVSINGLRVSVSGAGKTSMIITIPDGATTGKIGLSVAGLKTTSGQTFTVIQPPTITGFTPASGKAGESVTITGTNFDVSAANNIVKFNGKAAAIVGTPTSTNIVATIPSDASTGLITVTTNGITATSSSPFTVNVVTGDISKAPDNTTFVYPNPSTNYVYFSSDLDVQSSVQVNIFDSKGLSIEKLPYEVVSAKELRMDVSSLTSGLYVAKISVQDKIFHLKFVKENAK